MAATRLKLGFGALAIAGVLALLTIQHLAQANLRAENDSLQRQIAQLQTELQTLSNRLAQSKHTFAPSLPAPPMHTTAATASPGDDLQATNLYARINGTNETKLTLVQLLPYLKANGSNAASLLAAYRTSGDPALLAEAMKRFPNDPVVAFEAAFKKDSTPEERQQWLDALKKSAPDNPLPNYLSALDAFKAGNADQAVQELVAASGKQQLSDYTLERLQNDEEAYLAAGYSVAEAKTIPSAELLLPQLRQLRDLDRSMVDLAKSYQQSGDQSSAQTLWQFGIDLGQSYSKFSTGEPLISQLVGVAVEADMLRAMDPNSPYGDSGQTVQDRLNQLKDYRTGVNEIFQKAEQLFPTMSDQDWIAYRERWVLFGEPAAAQWLLNKNGQK